jgi:dystrophin
MGLLFQNHIKTLKKWMAEVDVFLKEEWPALGDSEILKKQLKQCRVRFLHDPFHMKTFI